MDKLEKLEKIKELIIKKLEISNDAREIEMLNEKYIIIISMIYNYQQFSSSSSSLSFQSIGLK